MNLSVESRIFVWYHYIIPVLIWISNATIGQLDRLAIHFYVLALLLQIYDFRISIVRFFFSAILFCLDYRPLGLLMRLDS